MGLETIETVAATLGALTRTAPNKVVAGAHSTAAIAIADRLESSEVRAEFLRLYAIACRCDTDSSEYKLVFGTPQAYGILVSGTLAECAAARKASGDLVLDPSGEVNQGDEWLFPWERVSEDCYARRAQRRWTY